MLLCNRKYILCMDGSIHCCIAENIYRSITGNIYSCVAGYIDAGIIRNEETDIDGD